MSETGPPVSGHPMKPPRKSLSLSALWQRRSGAGAAGLAALGVKLAAAVLGLGVNVVLARWLGPADYGVYAFGITVALALSIFASAGMPFAAIRHLPEYVARGAWAEVAGFRRASMLVTAAGSLLCVAGVLVLAGVLQADQAMTTALAWSAALVAPLAFAQTLATLLQARGRVAMPEAMQSLIRQGMTLLFLVLGAAMIGTGPGLAFASTAAATTLAAIALAMMLRHLDSTEIPSIHHRRYELRRWTRTGAGIFLILLGAALNEKVDILMLAWLVEPDRLGIYAAATRLSAMASLGLAGLNAAYMPRIARAWAEGDRQRTEMLCVEAARVGTLVVSIMLLGAILFGETVLAVFGAEFRAGAGVLQLLILGQIGVAAAGVAGGLAVITGRDTLPMAGVITGIALNIALNLLLVPWLGIAGAALATCIALSLSLLSVGLIAGRRLGLRLTLLPVGPRAGMPESGG